MEEERRIRKRRRREKEGRRRGPRRRGKEEKMRGWGGGAVFLAMQVLEIPAGGRGFPLVLCNGITITVSTTDNQSNLFISSVKIFLQ